MFQVAFFLINLTCFNLKTLIITNSYDVTTDILISQIGHQNVFRLNFDLLSNYSIYIDSISFLIRSPNREIVESEISKVYWRKPFNFSSESMDYEYKEKKQVVRQIFNILSAQGKAILVNPYKEFEIGKLLQLRIAKDYFKVPDWELILNHESKFSKCIAKRLSTSILKDDKIFYTSEVDTNEIDLRESWHLQHYLKKEKDLTIVFVVGHLFAFELDNSLNEVDWRKDQIENPKIWKVHKLDQQFSDSILKYMNKLNLDYGRLDFIIYNDEYYFLEVNVNGQWAFLDTSDQHGLLKTMAEYIHPLTKSTFIK